MCMSEILNAWKDLTRLSTAIMYSLWTLDNMYVTHCQQELGCWCTSTWRSAKYSRQLEDGHKSNMFIKIKNKSVHVSWQNKLTQYSLIINKCLQIIYFMQNVLVQSLFLIYFKSVAYWPTFRGNLTTKNFPNIFPYSVCFTTKYWDDSE